MNDTLIILHMLTDLITGGDPTLPSGHPNLIPIARFAAFVYDAILTMIGA